MERGKDQHSSSLAGGGTHFQPASHLFQPFPNAEQSEAGIVNVLSLRMV